MSAKSNPVGDYWNELFSGVQYFSPKPSTQFSFPVPNPFRADTDPNLNSQPWYDRGEFDCYDQSSAAGRGDDNA